jgi:pseudouridine-5'-phosphate glycosidase
MCSSTPNPRESAIHSKMMEKKIKKIKRDENSKIIEGAQITQ